MAGKLDQSLDEILHSQRQAARRPRGGRRNAGSATRSPVAAPVGGVQKTVRPTRSSGKPTVVPTGPASKAVDSKIIVSNLPSDVNEGQIKDFFSKAVGPIKKCIITYGPNGVSRGIATVIFAKADAASRAAAEHNGIRVDGRPLKIEVVLDASQAPTPAPVKALTERITQPKTQPKAQPKAAPKKVTGAANGSGTANGNGNGNRSGAASGRGRTRRGRNAGRGKPKTADELDAEMADYFESADGGASAAAPANANSGGAVHASNAAPVAANNGGGDTGMDDGVL